MDSSSHAHSFSFSSVPTSPDFIVFGITWNLWTWRPGNEGWNRALDSPVRGDFSYACNNPIFFRGEAYCLGRIGNVAVFNLETGKRRVLEWPMPIFPEVLDSDKEDCYLMEIEGELISVFPGNEGLEGSFRVFKLDKNVFDWNKLHNLGELIFSDRDEWCWTELRDLGDLTLFIDRRCSIAKRSPLKSCANRIYLPRFDDNKKFGAFYSLKARKYYPRVCGLTEPLNCVWIEPNFN